MLAVTFVPFPTQVPAYRLGGSDQRTAMLSTEPGQSAGASRDRIHFEGR